ncbi:MAG: chrA [Caulobacter sp.]|nr:chrA [Caulobacter sp.]
MSPAQRPPQPSFGELVAVFGRIGLINFGGPAGQIALMHRVVVDEKRWLEEDAFLRALNFCTLLPGPEAQQLATYVGWRLHGVRGGLAAGLLFIAPGAAVILGLSVLYAYAEGVAPVGAALLGVKAAVLAIVVEALIRLGRRALKGPLKIGLAVAAFAALFLLHLPFPIVVAGAALVGFGAQPSGAAVEGDVTGGWARLAWEAIKTIATWLPIWAAPLALLFVTLGPHHVLTTLGFFFGKLALVTFGGAYAVLSYMAQAAVETHHWMSAREMVDGLGLAETTPGPLILVSEFVGFQAAFRSPDPFTPLVAGTLGALLTLWMTFTPCFLWIFAGAPLMERLEHARRLQGALAAITAAVVGVIANLTVWFALHVVFRQVAEVDLGPVRLLQPAWGSLDYAALGMALLAAGLLFRLKLGVMKTLGVCMVAGLALHLARLI